MVESLLYGASMTSDAPPKRVVLIASEKGGVGKSVIARTLIDRLRVTNVRVAAYDADGTVGATVRVLGSRDDRGSLEVNQSPVKGIAFYNGRSEAERALLLDSIVSEEHLYIHDLAGGLLTDLTRIVDGGEGLTGLLDAFHGHGYRLTILHVVSPDVGSTASVSRWLDLTRDRCDHVAVINRKHGAPPNDFPFWCGFKDARGIDKGGKVRARLLSIGGVEVEFPSLPSGTFAKLDAENVAFSRADKAGLLTITERAHVSKFMRDFVTMFVPAMPFIST